MIDLTPKDSRTTQPQVPENIELRKVQTLERIASILEQLLELATEESDD